MTLEVGSTAAVDAAPGEADGSSDGIRGAVVSYLIGLALSALLTVAAFYLDSSDWLWAPSMPIALSVLAIAQVGVHLVFFLHLTSSPDSVNNSVALAFGALIVTLVIVGTLWIMAHMNANMPQMSEAMQPASRGAQLRTARGVIELARGVSVRASVEGVVRSVACEVATKVKEGQICATIDPAPFERSVAQKEGDLREWEGRVRTAEAAVGAAQAAVTRLGARPSPRSAAAENRLEAARARAAGAQAKLADLHKALDLAKAALDQTNVRAPIDGVVRARNAEPGRPVGPQTGEPLFVVALEPEQGQISILIKGDQAAALRVGQRVSLTVDRLAGARFEGEVVRIEPSSDPLGFRVRIVIVAPNSNGALRAGDEATIAPPAGN